MVNAKFPCSICQKNVVTDAVECELCYKWVHRRCAKLTKQQLRGLENDHFTCLPCKNLFPFQNIDDDEIQAELFHTYTQNNTTRYKQCKSFEFDYENLESINVKDWDYKINPTNFVKQDSNKCKYYTSDDFNKSFKCIEGLSIFHLNARSLRANFDRVQEFFEELEVHVDVIAISETWFADKDDVSLYSLPHYEMYNVNRNSRGGGCAIYVHKNLNVKTCEAFTSCIENSVEILTIEIVCSTAKNVLVSCLYRCPGSSIECVSDIIEPLLLQSNSRRIFLCGDFNINLLNYNSHNMTTQFVELLFSYGLVPSIVRPTRITMDSATLIDNIFTNCVENVKSGIICNDLSDHLPIFCCQTTASSRKSVAKYTREFTEANVNKFVTEVGELDWEEVLVEYDVNKAYGMLQSKLESLYMECFTLKKHKCKNSRNPWLTDGLINACKKKQVLYKRFLSNRTPHNESKYKTYKNKLQSILRIEKKKYYSSQLELNKGNAKETWKILKHVINKTNSKAVIPDTMFNENGSITGVSKIAEAFNAFFTNVGKNLADKIPAPANAHMHMDYLANKNDSTFFLTPVTEQELRSIVNSFSSKNSRDHVGFSMKLIKDVFPAIVKPFMHISNISFQTGIFPDEMKIAKIIPLYKSGDKSKFNNYRPVSLLPQLSKVLEKAFEKRLVQFLDSHKVLNEYQFGFRKARSTEMALLQLIEEATNALDNKQFALGVFIDLRKAFDTINHNILLCKLDHVGVRGIANQWLYSYLHNRKQFVELEEQTSSRRTVLHGVPQGSILGPILFLIYINDIINVSNVLRFVLFADDTNIFKSGTDLKQLCQEVSIELQKLHQWFNSNKLSLNVEKTNFMVFGNRSQANCVVKINEHSLQQVNSTKFLGVDIDERIKWTNYIDKVANKVSRSLSILYKAKYCITESALLTLYSALVLPYLTYAVEIWGHAYKSKLNRLVVLQKRCVRVVCNKGRLEHTNDLFLKLGILKFKEIVKCKSLILMFKAYNSFLPVCLQTFFAIGNTNLCVTTRQSHKFRTRYTRTTMKSQSATIVGAKLWNSLPSKLTQIKNIHNFKKSIKQHFLNEYTTSN